MDEVRPEDRESEDYQLWYGHLSRREKIDEVGFLGWISRMKWGALALAALGLLAWWLLQELPHWL